MKIREATFTDLEALMPIFHIAHEQSIFKGMAINESLCQRHFVTALEFDNGYAKVVERKGKVIGGLVGIISDNAFGIRCAQDLFCYSAGMTDKLLEDFALWSRVRGARFVQVTDLSNNERYQRLCEALGWQLAGTNFAKVM